MMRGALNENDLCMQLIEVMLGSRESERETCWVIWRKRRDFVDDAMETKRLTEIMGLCDNYED